MFRVAVRSSYDRYKFSSRKSSVLLFEGLSLSPVSAFSAIDSLKDTSLHMLAVPQRIHLRTYFDLRDPISGPVRAVRKYAEVEDDTN